MNDSLSAMNTPNALPIHLFYYGYENNVQKKHCRMGLNRLQIFLHSVYWIVALVCFLLFYSLIDSIGQGAIYASVGLPVTIGVTYLFIYWMIPNLLFKGRYVLFSLSTALTFLGVLNLLIVFALSQRLFGTEDIAAEVAFIHWDIVYLMVATLLLSLPAIAYETLRNWHKSQDEILRSHFSDIEDCLEVRSDGKTHRIPIDEIQLVESYADYAHIQLANQTIVTRITLKKLEGQLPGFVRVHRSFIVNPEFCNAFSRDEILIEEKKIPVGRAYRENVVEGFQLQ